MTRLRFDNLSGTGLSFSSTTATTGTWATAPGIPDIASGDYLALVLAPGTATSEIVWLTGPYSAGSLSATFTRGAEGTTPQVWSQVSWINAPTIDDFVPQNIGALTAASNLSDVLSAPQSLYNLGSPVLPPVNLLAPSNVDIASPGSTFDGVTPVVGDTLLLVKQTTGSQNGVWVYQGASTSLVRPVYYPSGGSVPPCLVVVLSGLTYANSIWWLVTSGAVVDSTATGWSSNGTPYCISVLSNSTSVPNVATTTLAPFTIEASGYGDWSSSSSGIVVPSTGVWAAMGIVEGLGSPNTGYGYSLQLLQNGNSYVDINGPHITALGLIPAGTAIALAVDNETGNNFTASTATQLHLFRVGAL